MKILTFLAGQSLNFIIQKFSLSQFSLVTGIFEGMKENISHIFRACIFFDVCGGTKNEFHKPLMNI